jgi:23S rRNA (cytidine1920-2'-O)/16S rRNA (cytidine1409-2'-O)-methyltransferase
VRRKTLAKTRIDKELVERGLVESREKAQTLVMAGQVFVNGQKAIKASQLIGGDAELEVRGHDCPYVSRGGWKLEAALDAFDITLQGARCLDLGASTGGFTDLMLQRGAGSVTAVDVGKGQLHWKLRNDPRVEVREKTNARYLKPEEFSAPFDFVTGDLSFIGLGLILPTALALVSERGLGVFLIKPQFEAGRGQVGRKGVVRDPQVHFEVLFRVLSKDYGGGFVPTGLITSPLKGPAGNIEYLVRFERESGAVEGFRLDDSVERALQTVRREWAHE